MPKGPATAWLVVIVALAVIGLAAWIYQLSRGLYVTDMRNLTSWSLYITMFTVAEGFAAGSLVVATMPRALGVKGFGSVTRIASYLAITCIVMAGAFIMADLGHPERAFNLLLHARPGSPMFGDVLMVALFFIASVAFLWALLRAEKGSGSERTLGILAKMGLALALLLPTATAWLFGLQIGRPVWNSALMAPSFIVSALVAGLALVIVVALLLRRLGYLELAADEVGRMATLLGYFVLADLFVLFCELITAAFPGAGVGYDAVASMLSGELAPLFWTEVIVGGALAAVLLLARGTRQRSGLVVTGAVLAILGVLLSKFDLIRLGFDHPNLNYPGVITGPAPPLAGSVYTPTFVEWGVVMGVVALGLILVTLGVKILALRSEE